MREAFNEWYYPDDDEIAHIVRVGTIALDANVLLDLYRVGSGRRQEILTALEKIGDRLFVPHQAAYEYQKNRTTVLHDAQNTFDKVSKDIEKAAQEALTTALQPIRDQEVREEIQDAFKGSFDAFKSRYAALRRSHILDLKEARTKDPVRDQLDRLLSGPRLGKKPSAKKLKERRDEAQKRIDQSRPPGHADAKNKPDASGDYLVWAELLDHAKDADRPMLFVTNDSKKGDWFLNVHNRTMGPLPELVAEMAEAQPDHRYHQVGLGSLLELTNKHLDTAVSEATINTVRVLKHDEDRRWQSLAKQLATLRQVIADGSEQTEEGSRNALMRLVLENATRDVETGSVARAVLENATRDVETSSVARAVLRQIEQTEKSNRIAEIASAADYIRRRDRASKLGEWVPDDPPSSHD
ncbi:Uncharacterised protein [Mycobacteroides abscessus subsp. abscessus]|uniref:PIN domain-containing protein n=1 Tax=Mycobacteroides abscessus TaxID=36809 RepID=UPI00092802BD|nr:PIN domain-containing protein [Mycobacteroides abscessus]SHR60999.1 Uncharacterised protein [Mycobacteroides abscessus subsp. abscessus]